MAAIGDSARMALMAGAAAGRLSLDALGDLTGRAMPYRANDVVQPQVLSRLINGDLLDRSLGPVQIANVARKYERRGEPVVAAANDDAVETGFGVILCIHTGAPRRCRLVPVQCRTYYEKCLTATSQCCRANREMHGCNR